MYPRILDSPIIVTQLYMLYNPRITTTTSIHELLLPILLDDALWLDILSDRDVWQVIPERREGTNV